MKNEKNKSCKNEDSYITGIFLLTKDEVIKMNKDNTSGNSPIPLKNRSDGFKWYFSIYITLYEYLQRWEKIKKIVYYMIHY